MTWDEIGFELAKLTLQALGAIFVARLAVRWALSRYKEEKTWERRLAAYAEVVAALSEMRFIVGKWIDEIEGHSRNDPTQDSYSERYKNAIRKFEEGTAISSLILESETRGTLTKLENDLDNVNDPDPYDGYSSMYSLIDDALVELTAQGRASLDLSAPKRGIKTKSKAARSAV